MRCRSEGPDHWERQSLKKQKDEAHLKESVSNEEKQNSRFPFCAYNCLLSVNTAECPLTWMP